jgi:hypothetical protein
MQIEYRHDKKSQSHPLPSHQILVLAIKKGGLEDYIQANESLIDNWLGIVFYQFYRNCKHLKKGPIYITRFSP